MPGHLALPVQPKLTEPSDVIEDVEKYSAHIYGRGGFYNMERQLETAVGGPCYAEWADKERFEKTWDDMEKEILKHSALFDPLSYREVLLSKDSESSVGLPLQAQYPNFGAFVVNPDKCETEEEKEEAEANLQEVIDEFEDLEKAILDGYYPIHEWRCFPKTDKYGEKKIKEGNFRIISCSGLFLLMLYRRYFKQIEDYIVRSVNQFHLITTQDLIQTKLIDRMSGLHTFGIDYSAFDKHSVTGVLRRSIKTLYLAASGSIPYRVYEYLVLKTSNPSSILCLAKNDTVETYHYLLNGSNPSGQYLTSYVNTQSHCFHTVYYLRKIWGVSPRDYMMDNCKLRSIMTGDDGVEGSGDLDFINKVIKTLPNFISDEFSIPAKLDLLTLESGEKDLYQPDLMAPYLNKVLIEREDGRCYQLYADPRRLVNRLLYAQQNEITGSLTDTFRNRIQGIMEELRSYVLHETLNPDLPRNSVVEAIRNGAQEIGATYSSDWRDLLM